MSLQLGPVSKGFFRAAVHRGLRATMALCLLAHPAQAQKVELPGLDSVFDELQQGGLVIYLRHAATDRSQSDAGADMTRCETQRNLSEKGRQQSKGIGKAIRSAGIPVGVVLSSPFCRCKDTAELAFGHYTVHGDLFFAVTISKAEVARMTQTLRRLLSTPPAKGTNTVIVSHTANLREAAGIWPDPEGAGIVFRPLGEGRFAPVAKILPGDWAAAKGTGAARTG